MRMANRDQFEILREVNHRLTTPGSGPLQIFFTGAAGSGKAFVLRLIMDLYNRYCNIGDADTSINAYIACATMGKAAVALGGVILHSPFKLTMTMRNRDPGLSNSDFNTFRNAFRNMRYIIIDEVNMMSADTLLLVDQRLRSMSMRLNEPFGGYDMILCGDLRQLPPVRASEVYKRSSIITSVFNAIRMLWHYLSFYSLKQVVQQTDITFSTLLTKIGDGAPRRL